MNKRHPAPAQDAMCKQLTRRAVLRTELCALGVCLLGADHAWADAPPAGFVVIVNAQNPVSGVARALLSQIFLKQITHWENGEIARPVDLSPDSAVRRAFSREVIGRSVAAVRHYWQQRIFSGRDVPPAELDSEEAVVRYVANYRGALGYVSLSVNVAGLKKLSVR
ncbi:MAG: substrate-binding domain-containing protein [Polyangiaceae bacterium]